MHMFVRDLSSLPNSNTRTGSENRASLLSGEIKFVIWLNLQTWSSKFNAKNFTFTPWGLGGTFLSGVNEDYFSVKGHCLFCNSTLY